MYKGLSLTIQKMKTFLMRGLRGISNDEKAQEQRGKIAQVIHIKNLYIPWLVYNLHVPTNLHNQVNQGVPISM